MLKDPEPATGMMDEGDGLAKSRGDFVIVALEVDGVVVVDAAGATQGKVQIEQCGGRSQPHAAFAVLGLGVPDFEGSFAEGAVDGAVLAGDLHLENLIGLRPGLGAGMGEQGHQAALEGAKAAFDLPLGLRGGCDEVGHAEPAQGALEFAFRIAVVVAGTGPEEAQTVGVDDLGQAPGSEGFAEVFEVVPGRVRLDETAGEVEAGMVVHGEQEGLLGGGRPPLVDGTVVLPKFADAGATEAAIDPGLACRGGHQMGVAGLDVGLHRGARPDQAAEPFQLIRDELVVGRILQRQELQQQAMSLGRPVLAPVAAAGLRREALACAEQSSAQLVEPGAAHPQMRGGRGGVERTCIEVGEDAADKFDGVAVDELLVFIAGTLPVRGHRSNTNAGPQPRRRPPLRSGLRRGCGSIGFHLCSVSCPVLNRLCPVLLRPRHTNGREPCASLTVQLHSSRRFSEIDIRRNSGNESSEMPQPSTSAQNQMLSRWLPGMWQKDSPARKPAPNMRSMSQELPL